MQRWADGLKREKILDTIQNVQKLCYSTHNEIVVMPVPGNVYGFFYRKEEAYKRSACHMRTAFSKKYPKVQNIGIYNYDESNRTFLEQQPDVCDETNIKT